MKLIAKITLALLAVIIIAGYFLSDDIYYREVIRSNQLRNPKEVFSWATNHYGNHAGVVHTNASPIHLMQKHKDLYCDEGAIVMATLDHELGYQTRLLDIVGPDSIAHHTVLQVLENNKWVNADFTTRTYGEPLSESAATLNINLSGEHVNPYPRLYNLIINNNYFLKKIAFTFRGINESSN